MNDKYRHNELSFDVQRRLESMVPSVKNAACAPELLKLIGNHPGHADNPLAWRAAIHSVLGSDDANHSVFFDFDDSYGLPDICWGIQRTDSSVRSISDVLYFDQAQRIEIYLQRLGPGFPYEFKVEPSDSKAITFIADKHLDSLWIDNAFELEAFDLNDVTGSLDKNHFFVRWYTSLRLGRPMDWGLQRQIARIPVTYWQMGLKQLTEVIVRIEGEWLAKETSVAEEIILNEDTFAFSSIPRSPANEPRLQTHLSRVGDALDDIIALGSNNGLNEDTLEYRIIKRLIIQYPDDPERIAFDLTDVNHTIVRKIEALEYADDEPIRLLQAANQSCVSAICNMDPEIGDELSKVYPIVHRKLAPDEKSLLDGAWFVSNEMLDETAALESQEDAEEILRGAIVTAAGQGLPQQVESLTKRYRSIVIRRQISRLATLARAVTKIPNLAKHYDSEWSKSAGVIARYGGVAGMLWAAVVVLGTLLGF